MIAASIVVVCIPVTRVLIVWSSDHDTNLTTVTMITNKTLWKEEVEYSAVNITTPQNQKSFTNLYKIRMPDNNVTNKPFKVYSTVKSVTQTSVKNMRTFPLTTVPKITKKYIKKLHKRPVTEKILPTTPKPKKKFT